MQASELRFSTARLFYFLTLCAAATSLFGWLGVPVGCLVMLVWTQILAGARRERAQVGSPRAGVTKLELVVVLLIATLVIGLLIPAVPEFDRQRQAETSMKIVAKAVEAYQQHFGVPPPVAIVSEGGRPLHSWRALILPFLGEEKLAESYRWDEPWDGPNNAQLAQYRPWHYRTYYPLTDAQRITTSLHLLRGADDVCYVVEHERAVSSWLEPTQLSDWQDFAAIADHEHGFWQHGFFSSLYHGRLAVSSLRSLQIHPQVTSDTNIEAHVAIKDGLSEKSTEVPIDIGQTYRKWHWDNAVRLVVFLAVALYPMRWLAQDSNHLRCLS